MHTAGRKWGRAYLTRAFFTHAREMIGSSALVVTCRQNDEVVAMSLSFMKGRHLYGRYWGCKIDADSLHFELCYHRLIDYAIAHKMVLVEAGAQGEHKIKRGFVPIVTHSAHWLAHTGLHEAIARAAKAEAAEIHAAMPEWTKEAPFREDTLPAWPPLAGIDLC
jgi:predicted N-acyltransferase